MLSQPVLLGLTLCERVIFEEETKNVTLVSGFQGLRVDAFPSSPQRISVFAVLTEGEGDVSMELVAHRLDTLDEIYNQQVRVAFPDRLAEVRVHFRLTQLVFPVPGFYQFSLIIGSSSELAQRRLRVYS